MFEELKQKSFKKCLALAIFCLVAGAAMVVLEATNVYYTVFGYADFSQLKPEEIKNQMVEINLPVNFGCFMESRERNTKTGATKTTGLWYVIYVGDSTSDDFRFMGIKVPPSYEKRMDKMADSYYNGHRPEPLYLLGKVRKMGSTTYSNFKKYFTTGSNSWTEEEFEESTIPYYIDYYHDSFSVGAFSIAVFAGGIVLIVLGILRIIWGRNGAFLKKLRADIRLSGYPDGYIESDYASAQKITKNDDIKMGRLMTYYHSGATYRAIPHNKVMWAYQNTVTHRTNGIKTGTSYSVVYYVDGIKNSINIAVPGEAAAQDMLRRMSTTCPWIVVGYSEEMRKLFHNNRAEFLNLRYNTAEHEPTVYESENDAG